MQDNPIQLAVIDMAGTTVADDGLVVSAFEAAATAAGVPESGPERDNARQYVLDTMGQSKISVFRALFETEELRAAGERRLRARLRAAHRRRKRGSRSTVRRKPITRLRDAGVRVALTTGLQRHHAGEAARRARLAVPGRPGARAGRRVCGVGPTPT